MVRRAFTGLPDAVSTLLDDHVYTDVRVQNAIGSVWRRDVEEKGRRVHSMRKREPARYGTLPIIF